MKLAKFVLLIAFSVLTIGDTDPCATRVITTVCNTTDGTVSSTVRSNVTQDRPFYNDEGYHIVKRISPSDLFPSVTIGWLAFFFIIVLVIICTTTKPQCTSSFLQCCPRPRHDQVTDDFQLHNLRVV